MTNFHRNIFSYFRGLSQPEHDRERQLEDNSTKALINTLEHTEPMVGHAFLKWLGIATTGKVHYSQQKVSLGNEVSRKKAQRLLIAIVGTQHEQNKIVCGQLPTSSHTGDSRPDAWIYGDEFVVLVETKVGDSPLTLNQMACHWQKIRPQSTKVITWAEVHRFFQGLSNRLTDQKSRWIVDQFREYLEWTGMTQFAGFREEMFEFFIAPERDPDMQRWVRSAVDGLAERVLNGDGGLKALDPWYSHKTIGNLPWDADHYWVAFGPDQTFRNSAHQTISLFEQHLDVFVNVELLPAIKKLRRKIKDGGFREVMANLPAPFTACIQERKKTDRPRIFTYSNVAEIESGTYKKQKHGLKNTKSIGFDYLENILSEIALPSLSIRRRFTRAEVLEFSKNDGEPLVKEVLATLLGFHPLVEFINSAKRDDE